MKLIKFKTNKVNNLIISNSYKNLIKFNKKKKILIFDYNIYNIFFIHFKKVLNNFFFLIIPNGEKTKNFNLLKIIWKFMIKKKINKNFLIYAIGGGVINDLIGFIASTYFRGINFYVLPTTLLSQIDSSIGGKTAVNFYSKNSIGLINNSNLIFINFFIIFYMKKNELKDGFAEIIKYSLINNKNFFFYLLKKYNFKKVLIRSCYFKIKIISQDFFEKNIRTVLNLGHTYAHCIENNLINNFSHGESVSIGIIFSLIVSTLYYKNIYIKKIFILLKNFNFILKNKLNFSKKMILKFLLDKKFDNKINYIIIKNIGNCIQKIIKKTIIIKLLKI